MSNYVYVCWFRDHTLLPEDQDYEGPACILISADSDSAALSWGDHLAARYCREHEKMEYLRSYIDPEPYRGEDLPRVAVGEEASDKFIGW